MGDGVGAAEDGRRPEQAPQGGTQGIKAGVDLPEAFLEGLHGHSGRPVDHGGHVVAAPVAGEDAALGGQTGMDAGAGKRGQHRQEGPVQGDVVGEVEKLVEHVRGIVIVAEDEGAVDPDAVGVDAADGFPVGGGHALPFAHGGEVVLVEAFQTDEDAVAAGPGHAAEQGRVLGHGDGGLTDPAQAAAGQAGQQRLEMLGLGRDVVVAEKDVARRPREGIELGQDVFHGPGAVGAAQKGRHRAEFAFVRAAPGGLDDVFEKVAAPGIVGAVGRREDRHAGVGGLFVAGLQASGRGVGQNVRPDCVGSAPHRGVGMGGRLVGEVGDVDAPEDDRDAPGPVMVGDLVGARRQRRHGCDGHHVRGQVRVEGAYALVHEGNAVPGRGERAQGRYGQGGETKTDDVPKTALGPSGNDVEDVHRRTGGQKARGDMTVAARLRVTPRTSGKGWKIYVA